MKNLFHKVALAIVAVLLSASLASCNSTPEDEPVKPKATTVSIPMMRYSSLSGSTAGTPKILDKLKQLQFISGYTYFWVYIVEPVAFKQANVNPADTTRVKAELLAKADAHYTAALANVKAFDFNTLFTEDIVNEQVEITISFNGKEYAANVHVQKPLIFDKAWSTSVAECPIQEMSFAQSNETVTGTLKLLGGSEVQTTSARRNPLNATLMSIGTTANNYTFKILSPTQIQLTGIKPTNGTPENVTDKNYIFNHKN